MGELPNDGWPRISSEGIDILEVRAESRHLVGKVLLALGLKNLGASKIVARIARKTGA